MAEAEGLKVGSKIIIHLNAEAQEFSKENHVKEIVEKYRLLSNHEAGGGVVKSGKVIFERERRTVRRKRERRAVRKGRETGGQGRKEERREGREEKKRDRRAVGKGRETGGQGRKKEKQEGSEERKKDRRAVKKEREAKGQ